MIVFLYKKYQLSEDEKKEFDLLYCFVSQQTLLAVKSHQVASSNMDSKIETKETQVRGMNILSCIIKYSIRSPIMLHLDTGAFQEI